MGVLMRWFHFESPGMERFPPFLRAFGICKQEGHIYLSVALAGDGITMAAQAQRQGVEAGEREGHLYLPADWLARQAPECAEVVQRLHAMAASARPDAPACVLRYMQLVGELGLDDLRISRQLDQEAIARTMIEKVVWFTPIALGRRAMQRHGVRFSPAFHVFDPDGVPLRSGVLADEPIYQAACDIERALLPDGAVKQIVMRSPEVLGFQEARQQGTDPQALATLPVVFFAAPPSAAGLQAAHAWAQRQTRGATPL